jgi:SAM-dependent methyltransferase
VNTQPVASAAPRDEATLRYFDAHTPEYDESRLGRAADAIARRADASSSLIDLGCGAGNTLRFLMERTGIREVAGVDVSPRYLALTHEEVGCPVYEGSVLDQAFVAGIGRRYDFAVVAAVLHHLIGRTRSASRAHAELAISNALRLLRPGGFLVVVEPVWYPSLVMDGLFYVKKALTAVTSERVSILGEWNNIGPPVVSYYTTEQLCDMLAGEGGLELVEKHVDEHELAPVLRPFLRRVETTLVAEAIS